MKKFTALRGLMSIFVFAFAFFSRSAEAKTVTAVNLSDVGRVTANKSVAAVQGGLGWQFLDKAGNVIDELDLSHRGITVATYYDEGFNNYFLSDSGNLFFLGQAGGDANHQKLFVYDLENHYLAESTQAVPYGNWMVASHNDKVAFLGVPDFDQTHVINYKLYLSSYDRASRTISEPQLQGDVFSKDDGAGDGEGLWLRSLRMDASGKAYYGIGVVKHQNGVRRTYTEIRSAGGGVQLTVDSTNAPALLDYQVGGSGDFYLRFQNPVDGGFEYVKVFGGGSIDYNSVTKYVSSDKFREPLFALDGAANSADVFAFSAKVVATGKSGIFLGNNPDVPFLIAGDTIKVIDKRYPSGNVTFKLAQANILKVTTGGDIIAVVSGFSGDYPFFGKVQFSSIGCDVGITGRIPQGNDSKFQFLEFSNHPGDFSHPVGPARDMAHFGCAIASHMMVLGKYAVGAFFAPPSSMEMFNQWDDFRQYVDSTGGFSDSDNANKVLTTTVRDYFNSKLRPKLPAGTPSLDLGPHSQELKDDESFTALNYKSQLAIVKDLVCNGMPVHLRVPSVSGTPGLKHSVVAIGTEFKDGKEVIRILDPSSKNMSSLHETKCFKNCNDPDPENRKTFSFNDTMFGIRALRQVGSQLNFGKILSFSVAGGGDVTISTPHRLNTWNPEHKTLQYAPFIKHDDSAYFEGEDGEAIQPNQYLENYYLAEPTGGNYQVSLQGAVNQDYVVEAKLIDVSGNVLFEKTSSGKYPATRAGQVDLSFDVPPNVFLGGISNLSFAPSYSATPGTDSVIVKGNISKASDSDGISFAGDVVHIVYPQLHLDEILTGQFQRIAGGYRYQTTSLGAGIKFLKVMDDGQFELRAKYLDLSRASLEAMGEMRFYVGNDSFIGHPNSVPVAKVVGPSLVSAGSSVSLDGTSSSDFDAQSLSYTWELFSKPQNSSASLVQGNSSVTSFTADKAGQYVVKLTVSDGIQNSVPKLFTVRAESESAPSVPGSDNGFIRLSSDQGTYLVGASATLSLLVTAPPGSTDEYFYRAHFNGVDVSLTAVDATHYTFTTPPLSAEGEQSFSVNLFIQNKALAAQLASSVTYYQREIARIDAELANETDADHRAALEQEKADDQAQLDKANDELERNRTRIGGDAVLKFQVVSSKKK